ncbi:MAG: ribonuclease J, partial [Candidatus Heimdallarchaeota archaeon]|nr:ribonuclease J [Candidatus Heimdallarchaeota archaeon]
KVAIVGRSLSDIISVAHESGYLNDFHYLTPEEARHIPKDKLLLICTGCQGDELASINKLANQIHPVFTLEEDDTVIFSSKIIPGNEKRIFSILNKFTRLGVQVITERNHNVHVSGHPYRGELNYMYDLVKPKAAIPVHGEHMHVKEHVKLVRSLGINSMIVENGDVIWLDSYDGMPTKISSVDTSFLCVDGTVLQDPEGLVIKCRKRLALAGIVCVFILVKRKDYSLVKTPYIVAPGLTINRKLLEGISTALAKGIKKMEKPVKNEIIRLARSEIKKAIKYTGKSGYLVEVCIDLINS